MLPLLGAPLVVAAPTNHSAVAHGIGSAPAGLVAAIARTQASEAAQNLAYAIDRNGCAQIGERTNASVLAGCFGKKGPAFSTGKHTIRLRLIAWGRAGQLRPVTLTRMAPQANRIEYHSQRISEWWRVLPLGYEQGFIIAQASAGHGKVVLQLSASRAPKIAHGTLTWGQLRYGKLHVTDAAGHVLPATLSAQGTTITLAFDAAHARYPVTVDPLVWVQQQEVTAANGAAGDFFGNSVALSDNGTTALVGADNKTIGGNTGQGAAYVYTLAGGTWSQTAELIAANGAASDNFGCSVALSSTGATALVGASGKTVGQGAAYVYTLASGTWSQAAELTASNGAADDYFGISVALSSTGATALVGAYSKTVGSNTDQGAAYVYTLAGGVWGQAGELTASNGAAHDYFGSSVALSSNGATALVGADGKTVGGNTDQGAAYVFTTTRVWSTSTQTELTASNGATFDSFGSSVALSANGSTALVGAYQNNGSRGAAYVFTTTNVWPTNTQAELTASGSAVGDYFGSSVALSADGITALVGAPSTVIPAGNNIHGAAYFFGNSDLSVVLSAPAMVQTGAQFSSQYILTNASATASAALVVSLPVPATNAGYVSASASQGTCSYDSTTKVATCAVGSILGNGGTASATLNLKATGAAGLTIAQSGQLANASPDLAQTTSTTIVPPPPSGGGAFGPWVLLGLLGLALLIGLARRRIRD